MNEEQISLFLEGVCKQPESWNQGCYKGYWKEKDFRARSPELSLQN